MVLINRTCTRSTKGGPNALSQNQATLGPLMQGLSAAASVMFTWTVPSDDRRKATMSQQLWEEKHIGSYLFSCLVIIKLFRFRNLHYIHLTSEWYKKLNCTCHYLPSPLVAQSISSSLAAVSTDLCSGCVRTEIMLIGFRCGK